MEIQQSMACRYVCSQATKFLAIRRGKIGLPRRLPQWLKSLKIKSLNTPTCALLQAVAHLNHTPRPMKEAPRQQKADPEHAKSMGPTKSI
jgi:hypothetical protein